VTTGAGTAGVGGGGTGGTGGTGSTNDASDDGSGTGGAGGDSTDDAAPEIANPGAPVDAILLAKSPDCLACAQGGCPNYITGCATIGGQAKAGPAVGEDKSALCIETLACVLPTGCAVGSTAACYCGNDHPDPDFNCNLDSPCSRVLERSLETSDPTTVLISMGDMTKGGGWAMSLMQCLRDNQCAACLSPPPDDGGTDGGDDAEAGSTNGTQKSPNRHMQRLIGSAHHGNR
jgi:hypothetical protein